MASDGSLIKSVFARVEVKLILAWLVLIVVTTFLDPSRSYLENPTAAAEPILRQAVFLGFFALGSAVIIISGGIDLSSGAVIALSATVFSCLLVLLDPEGAATGELQTWVVVSAVLGALFSGVVAGTLNAWLITGVGLPPFIATLATMVGLRSFSRGLLGAVTEGSSQISFPACDAVRDPLKDVTYVSIVFIVFAIGMWFLMSRTVVGRHLHAMGGNETAAKLSGIRTDRLKWLAYVIGATSASIMGIVYFADQGSAKPDVLARGYELNAIAAAVIGGCSLAGGIGTIPGTVLGCLFLRSVMDAVNKVVEIGADIFEGMIVGFVVVLAVTFSQRESTGTQRVYFATPIGWTAAPILGAIAGLSTVFFFREKEGFAAWQPIAVGLIVTAILVARGMSELWRAKRSLAKTKSGKEVA